jgi:hypothetical protein
MEGGFRFSRTGGERARQLATSAAMGDDLAWFDAPHTVREAET